MRQTESKLLASQIRQWALRLKQERAGILGFVMSPDKRSFIITLSCLALCGRSSRRPAEDPDSRMKIRASGEIERRRGPRAQPCQAVSDRGVLTFRRNC